MDVPRSRVQAVRVGEEAMARRIALSYLVSQPISTLGALVPGKFLYDAVKRGREVAWSRDRYIPPRLEALELASARLASDADASADWAGEDDPSRRLVLWLTEHDVRVLSAEGKRYDDLLQQAYPNPVDLEAAWDALELIEADLDEVARRNRPSDAKLAARLEEYRECAHYQRRRHVHELYYE